MKINTKAQSQVTTHEGGPSRVLNAEEELRRTILTCLLWEDHFYEDGQSVAQRIASLIQDVDPSLCSKLAVEAREQSKLRHVPLLIVREMARLKTHRHLVAQTLERVIQRPDELTEFLSIYWKEKRQPLSAQVKKGLAKAFTKFKPDTLAKYNRGAAVKLKDVLFLSHAKPKNEEQAEAWKKLINGQLESPDTWEVALSSGSNKKETFERLMTEQKLGALAFLRNMRNMIESKCDESLMKSYMKELDVSMVLPFRFISAARHAPQFEPELETLLFKSLSTSEKLTGKTIVLVDVSGSMEDNLSSKSEMKRLDAACGVAMICREVCESGVTLTFSDQLAQIPNRRGFALRDAIVHSQPHSGTALGRAIETIHHNQITYDRLIVITDEQSSERVPIPQGKGYILNVASYKNGISTNQWTTITGWSDSVIKYILTTEQLK